MTRCPFPSIGSPIYNVSMRDGGDVLLDQAWVQVRSNSIDLRFDFIDSNIVSNNVFFEGFVYPFELSSVVLHKETNRTFFDPSKRLRRRKTNILRVENSVGFGAEFCKAACTDSSP